MKIRFFLLICSFILLSNNAFAVDPDLNWKTIENKNLYVHYAQGNKTIAERVLAIAESAHYRLTKELNWTPKDKTHLVLSDETDQPNGFASPLFFNHSVIFLAPPSSVNTLEDFDDWLTTIIVHEYTHIIHLDKSAGAPEYLRNVFGRFFFLFPNLFQPSWIMEGLATHKETDIERGIGRGQSAMFDTMMRQEVAKGLQPISHVNLPVVTWPAGTTRYLYGVYFMQFITERYGADKLQLWIEEYSDNLFPFFINTNANKILGKNLTPLWQEYKQWLNNKFQPQIKAIKAKGMTVNKQLSKDAYRTNSVRAIKNKKGVEVYYVQNNGYQRASLMHINSEGKSQALIDLNGEAQLDLHVTAGLLLTQNEFCNNYTIYSDIYRYHFDTKKLKRLTQCGRYLFASWFPDGKQIMAVHHNAGKFELQQLDEKAQLKTVLWQAEDNEIIGQIDVSKDGKQVVASVWRKGYGWNIELFDIKHKQWRQVTQGTSIAVYPQYTQDGDILFSMEADGVYNLYRYHLPGHLKAEKVEQLTNLIGGAFQSSQPHENGSIYYSGYSAEGFAIYEIIMDKMMPDKAEVDGLERVGLHDELHDKSINKPKNKRFIAEPTFFKDDHLQLINYKISTQDQDNYSPWNSLSPRWWFPSFEFSEQRSQWGLTTAGADALGIHHYFLTASYDTRLDEPAVSLGYGYTDRLFLSWARINDIFLDSTGGINQITRRDVASLTWTFHNRRIQKQSSLLLGITYDKTYEQTGDHGIANGTQPWSGLSDPALSDHVLGLAWLYHSADTNPLSISLVDGMQLRLVGEDSNILNSDFSGQVYTLDWKQYIRIGKESVFALRFLQGWGTDSPRLFKLGGEGFSQDALGFLLNGASSEGVFNRRSYALRGYKEGLPQLRGRRVQLLSGEWRFPLQRFESGVMTPPVGIMQWFATLFAETGSAYQNSPESYYASVGLEITADVNLFYNVLLRTRLGYAHGFDSDIGENRLYLKIGSSF
jgi:hypothetical protein